VKKFLQCTALAMLTLGSFSLWATKATRGRGLDIPLSSNSELEKPTFGAADCKSDTKIALDTKNSNPIENFVLKEQTARDILTCVIPLGPGQHPVKVVGNSITVRQLFPDPWPGCNGTQPTGATDFILCYYKDDGSLVGSSVYTIDTRPSKIESSPEAFPDSVTFNMTVNKTGLQIQVCYGPGKAIDLSAALSNDKPCNAPYQIFGTTFNGDKPITITGLTKGTQYAFAFRVKGETAWQGISEATPQGVISALAFSNSQGAPGTSWSCDASKNLDPINGGTALLMILAGLLFAIRSKRMGSSRFLLLTIAAAAIAPAQAIAEVGDLSVGILGSPYLPNLDAERLPDGSTVTPMYWCMFASSGTKNRPILPFLGLEADAHVFDDFGSLQVGLGTGYTFVSGYAPLEDSISDVNPCGMPSASSVTLHMLQLRPQVTYVFNPYIKTVPLAPYARAAFVAHGYLFDLRDNPDKGGQIVGRNPIGFRFGYEVALGLMLLLDFFEPTASTQAQHWGSYKHSYLKAEVAMRDVTSFGSPGFNFSPKDIAFGSDLPLMFNFGLVVEFG
jgi:hypothetical protein